jgi:hypothetical protein
VLEVVILASRTVTEISGDEEAAGKVALVLPENGVCSWPGLTVALAETEAAGCCGGRAPKRPAAAASPA